MLATTNATRSWPERKNSPGTGIDVIDPSRLAGGDCGPLRPQQKDQGGSVPPAAAFGDPESSAARDITSSTVL